MIPTFQLNVAEYEGEDGEEEENEEEVWFCRLLIVRPYSLGRGTSK
jgi:hypothetical protein